MNEEIEKESVKVEPTVDSPKIESNATPELTKEEKEAQFKEAYKALMKLQRAKMGKRSSKGTPGAFGGAHPGIKRKKKFARWVARNTV